jgi:hypothetical protein
MLLLRVQARSPTLPVFVVADCKILTVTNKKGRTIDITDRPPLFVAIEIKDLAIANSNKIVTLSHRADF